MSKNRHPMSASPNDTNALLAWVQDVARQARLAWRLLWDQRVPLWTKLIPPAALAYVIFPVDILPDLMPGLGQLDDIAILLIGVKLFIELAPPDVVREHLRALGAHISEWRVVDEEEGGPSVVIEGEYQLQESKDKEKEEVAEAEEL